MMLEDKLSLYAEVSPNKIALQCEGNSYNYATLYKAVCNKKKTLGDIEGMLVPIVAFPSFDFIVSYFAIHLAGAVAVPLGKDISDFARNQYVNTFMGKKAPLGIADILLTTGTTGNSKAVMVSHEAIMANAENLVDSQLFNSELTYIINGPLNHLGSLSKIYPVLYVGGTIRLIDGLKDINVLFQAIDEAPSKVATFLVPDSIRMLLSFAKSKLSEYASKIDFIETGAAPMSQEDMLQLCHVLPQSRLYNTYASTETGIVSTYNFNNGNCLAGCLGLPMKHSSFFITEDGLIGCKGKTLMSGYWNDMKSTDLIMQNGTVVTADLGYIDEQGCLRLQGRNDDIINIGGYKIAPTEIENVALSFPGIKDCVCIAAVHPVMNRVLKLLVVPEMNYNRKELVSFLKSKLEAHKIPILYEEIKKVQRTFNGKIDRKSYR